jgi:CRISPR-associated protein Cas2
MKRKGTGTGQTMCYIVAYDISDDRRRAKVHHVLQGFGKWTQYSLFECFLTRRELLLLQVKLHDCLSETQDSVRLYPLCATCISHVHAVGGSPPHDDLLFIV